MLHSQFLPRTLLLTAARLVALAATLTACGTPAPGGSASVHVASVETGAMNVARVRLRADDTPDAVAARLAGRTLAFLPARGVALVLTPYTDASEPPETASLTTIEPDRDTVRLRPLTASGTGWIWSDGTGWVWSDGTGWIWSDGRFTPLPANSAVWRQVKLDQAQAAMPELGQGVLVAVLDTGVDTQHPALRDRLAPPETWRDYIDNDALPDESGATDGAAYGHGTAMATIVAQVSPRARILPFRVLDAEGRGRLSDVVTAVVRATTQGARVINLSLGTDRPSPALEAVLDHAEASGVVVVAAAGNRGLTELDVPARTADTRPRRLSVASVGETGARSPFSNHGTGLELYAPGENVAAAAPANRGAVWSGTSVSTAVVAGAVSLGLSTGGTPDTVTRALQDTTTPLPGASVPGAGTIDLAAFARRLGR